MRTTALHPLRLFRFLRCWCTSAGSRRRSWRTSYRRLRSRHGLPNVSACLIPMQTSVISQCWHGDRCIATNECIAYGSGGAVTYPHHWRCIAVRRVAQAGCSSSVLTTGSSGLSDDGESSPLSTSTPEYPAPRARALLRVSSRPTSSKSELTGDDLESRAAWVNPLQLHRQQLHMVARLGARLISRQRDAGCIRGLHRPEVALLAAREDAPAPGLFMCRGVVRPPVCPAVSFDLRKQVALEARPGDARDAFVQLSSAVRATQSPRCKRDSIVRSWPKLPPAAILC